MNKLSICTSDPKTRKLESVIALTALDRNALERLPISRSEIRADQDIVREGDRPSRSCIILTGFACSYKITSEGKRQITAFHMPGDMPDLLSLHLTVLDASISTITACKVGFVQHEDLETLCAEQRQVGRGLWRETLIDAAVFREWVVNVGRRPANARIAHVFCELVARLGAIGLAEDLRCEFPITQSELADASGLSAVHVNRVLQELRAARLITLEGGFLQILDWEGLSGLGDFDPTYLHLRPAGRRLPGGDGGFVTGLLD